MEFSCLTPDKNATYQGDLIFSSAEEGIAQAFRERSGTYLLVSDEKSYPVFSAAARRPRTLSMVIERDALPLFSAPEVCYVLAAGGKYVLAAARFFAEIRRVPCVLFPVSATLDGAIGKAGHILIGGETCPLEAGGARICCDTAFMEGTFSAAYAKLLLKKLEWFEERALAEFHSVPCDREDTVYFSSVPEELIREVARVGGLTGEGGVLSERLEERGGAEEKAFLLLSSLYAAFFKRGKPRRYFTPDYGARARAAGTEQTARIPTAEEYAVRAMILEKMRAARCGELAELGRAVPERLRAPTEEIGREEMRRLKYLPEYCPTGLSAIIRDFGLMDWED